MAEDWAAVAKAINDRMIDLGWRQRELAERSHVSPAIVREIQRHTVERRRSPRTLESLSVALGWNPRYLNAVLNGMPGLEGEPATREGTAISSRLDALEGQVSEIIHILYDLKSDLAAVIEHARKSR